MRRRKVIASFFIAAILLLPMLKSTVYAEETPVTPPVEEKKDKDYRICEKDDLDCLNDTQGKAKTASFISDALLSIDEAVSKVEASKDYNLYFYNSTQTAMARSLSLFRPYTIVMTIINFVTTIFEMLGMLVSFFVMVIYNFTSSTFMVTIVSSVFDIIDDVMFNWSDPNAWIRKAILVIGLLSIGYKIIKNFKYINSTGKIFKVIGTTVISMAMVAFIGQYGRPILSGVENKISTLVLQTFNFDGTDTTIPIEVQNKETIFNLMQLQPFMMRHFGTASYTGIAINTYGEATEKNVKEANERVKKLLKDPSQDNAEAEEDDYNNGVISKNIATTSQVLALSLISVIHRCLIGIIIVILSLCVGAVKLLKEILLGLCVYQMMLWLFKPNKSSLAWFADRVQWIFVSVGADILFSTFLFFIFKMCEKIADIHVLLLLAFDGIMIFLIKILWANREFILDKLKETAMPMISDIVVGNQSPSDVYHKAKKGGYKNGENNSSIDTSGGNTSDIENDNNGDNLDDTAKNNQEDKPFEDTSNEDLSDHEDSQNQDSTVEEDSEKSYDITSDDLDDFDSESSDKTNSVNKNTESDDDDVDEDTQSNTDTPSDDTEETIVDNLSDKSDEEDNKEEDLNSENGELEDEDLVDIEKSEEESNELNSNEIKLEDPIEQQDDQDIKRDSSEDSIYTNELESEENTGVDKNSESIDQYQTEETEQEKIIEDNNEQIDTSISDYETDS